MMQISAEVLVYFSEAAMLVKHGKLSFANSAARGILGNECIGRSVKSIFGEDISESQASSFVSNAKINDREYIVRVSSVDGTRLIFITEQNQSLAMINDALICSLRSSLMDLGLSTEMLRAQAEQNCSKELMRGLSSITHDYHRINRILSNITVVYGKLNNSMLCTFQQIDIALLLRELVHTTNLLFKDIEFVLHAPERLEITADSALIHTMMLNLISNCLVHAEGCNHVDIRVTEMQERILISVSDNGCGIEPEHMHCVFDRYRHRFELKSSGRGSGLGMTTALDIAQAHGGTLMLESRPGSGTTVRVSISRNPVPQAQLFAREEAPETSMADILTGYAGCLPDEFFGNKYSG